jgi:phosphoglycolate phosphatase
MIKAVIFDADGTLVDSFDIIVRAYAHIADKFGYAAPMVTDIRSHLAQAHPLPLIMQTFFPDHDVEELIATNGLFVAAHVAEAAAYEGLHDLLAGLHDQGVKLAIVTGGNRAMHDVLQHHIIDKYFSSVVHCDRVSRIKPDPEGFFLALKECGVEPHEAIMVGDSPNDIFAGKNGGAALTIAITHGSGSHDDLQAADPDYVVDSLPELAERLNKLLSHVTA